MVALMRLTKDICRLLGIGSEGPSERREDMLDYEGRGPERRTENGTLIQDGLEEGLSEEERTRRKAERRKAKRKRQRERKKLEKVKKNEGNEQAETEGDAEESEVSDSEEETVEVGELVSPGESRPVTLLATSGNGNNRQPPPSMCEEEPEWDVSSAFVANAASHIRPKPSRRSKENKENDARTREVNGTGAVIKKSTALAEKGIQLVQEGLYFQAVEMFTEAIKYDPKDYRFFGNRSYCHECLEQYPSALADAERSIHLAADWPKGYFRKGRALMGMKRYGEAEKALEEVLKLDQDCKDAVTELLTCRVLQLMELGFTEQQSVQLLDKFSTVQAVLAAKDKNSTELSYSTVVGDLDSLLDISGTPCASLWVGNVTTELKEKQLRDLFKSFGEIDSIRVLHERFCAFVNFKTAAMAARAMDQLQGVEVENTRLVIRYPDRRPQRTPPSPQRTATSIPPAPPQPAAPTGPRRRGPVNGDECYFWRTSGCHFGDKCRYKHIPGQRGRDRRPWQP
ncbi:stress-induced-phosphoprotein 1 isoform X2 [Amia ocellicauda]|uniref:stress-induced-phosphoprotein 1 isoform X2 n=1 Tax=Amia ocellicauda TaxID=2972642 RepID=UPI00346470FB